MESKLGYVCHVFLQSRVYDLLPKPAEVTLKMSFKENRWAYSYVCRVHLEQSNKRGYMSRFYGIFSGKTPGKNVQLSRDDLMSYKAEKVVTLSVADIV